MRQRTLRFYSSILISLATFGLVHAQQLQLPIEEEKTPLFCGLSVSVDVAGPAMLLFGSNFSQMEGALRVNLKEKYFPIVEAGYGISEYVGEETNKVSRTQAPYMRLGMDYNFSKSKDGNRIFAGVRYGFTAFRYDLLDESFRDPVWDRPAAFHLDNEPGRAHWGEVVFGLEAALWKYFHMGWTLRYKARFNQKTNRNGEPWYLPGFGKNGTTCLGGTFNLIFDI